MLTRSRSSSHQSLTFTLNLVDIFLPSTESQTEVDDFEDAVLAGPENVAGLQVAVHDVSSVKGKERDQNILGKLETRPRRQPASIIFVNNLKKNFPLIIWSYNQIKILEITWSYFRSRCFITSSHIDILRLRKIGNNIRQWHKVIVAWFLRHFMLFSVSTLEDNFFLLRILGKFASPF